ncbi:MAG: phenylalanine--tRNA ligase subunit beta [Planctomycetota bacterium]|nr:phenylalanine--tRNA ligase subunit beta [Planctomycetota bacterium]
MKATLKWINELCPADLDTDALCAALVQVGFEMEEVEEFPDDTAIELEITANHAEWMSVIGIAREVAAVTGVETKLPSCEFEEGEESAEELTSVEVTDQKLCPYYGARVLRGVKVAPSPAWVQRRLELIGLRPVNNIADITNLVMYETGQPLHAFDYNKLAENRIVVRPAREGEKMVAINGKELTLSSERLVIADAEKPVALAGVMGGANSEITEFTTDILLECAAFDGPSIRRTTRATGITSDSSARFERGTDIVNADYASRRATAMILSICGGTAAKGVVEVKAPLGERKKVTLRHDRVNRILGMQADRHRTEQALKSLGFEIKESVEDKLTVLVPSWRKDVTREIDLIEEVARIAERLPPDSADLTG